MTITAALVLFSVLWFIVFFVVLQLTPGSQADAGEITPGTHAGAPANPQIKRKALITTAITTVLFIVIAGIIVSGVISIRDLDIFGRMGPPPVTGN